MSHVTLTDRGAGKTIMAGLYIKELLLRGALKRCLVVAPGGLVAQWQDELGDRFGLEFTILTRDLIEASRNADPFAEHDLLIARLDHLSRSDDLVDLVGGSEWDLVVVDEAHRMSAHFFGNELKETRRYRLGKVLGGVTRHLLLMTATPHAGKEEDFQLFLALLDPDRFEGRPRSGAAVSPTDTTDLMRRMVKEKLLRFDGRPLFPERRATTVSYPLSTPEADLYSAVTDYVTDEMNRADRLTAQGDGRRGNRVGFAVTVLQRRLASSPDAIHQSLVRRRDRLERRLVEDDIVDSGADVDVDDLDEEDAETVERVEEELVDEATAARTKVELEAEIATLKRLVDLAAAVARSGRDRKWTEMAKLLGEVGERKLIVFTEHRDTLNMLVTRIRSFFGRDDAVVSLHGGVHRRDRRRIQDIFTSDPCCQILVATDAAGEGINLQRAHLLVNYDLPWNPNRIEQRFGRVHRIGQTEVCHLWNLVAEGTREGDVYRRLLEKLEEQRRALGTSQVWDVLGSALPGRALRDLLIEAIRYGDRPDVRARLDAIVDERVGEGMAELVAPGHPLLDAVLRVTIERDGNALQRGAVLVDETDSGTTPRLLAFIDHSIVDGRDNVVSRRFEYAEVTPDGTTATLAYAPYLDHRPATEEELARLGDVTQLLPRGAEQLALDAAIEHAVPAHLIEVRVRVLERVRKVRAAVRERLTREIAYWDSRASELRAQADAGKQPRMNPDRAQARADDLASRLAVRSTELEREEQLSPLPPVLVGGALVVPAGLLSTPAATAVDVQPAFTALSTEEVERRAVDAVLDAENRLGRRAFELRRNNPGYDIRSDAPEGETLLIEVKGRLAGGETFFVTRTEILAALNVPDAWVLAMVEVSPEGRHADRVRYLRRPFGDTVNLPFATTATALDWQDYWARAEEPS